MHLMYSSQSATSKAAQRRDMGPGRLCEGYLGLQMRFCKTVLHPRQSCRKEKKIISKDENRVWYKARRTDSLAQTQSQARESLG
jgi:hypothetical protein